MRQPLLAHVAHRLAQSLRQPSCHFREKYQQDEHCQLDNDERDNAPVQMPCTDLGRGDSLEVEERKAKGGSKERSLEVHANQNSDPQQVHFESCKDRNHHGHKYENNFNKVNKKASNKHSQHDKSQESVGAEVGLLNDFHQVIIAAHAPEH